MKRLHQESFKIDQIRYFEKTHIRNIIKHTHCIIILNYREKSAPVGFQYNLNAVIKESDVKEEMTSCLDRWQTQETKKKKKQPPSKMEDESEVAIESLGKGTAVLLPKHGTADVWVISSEDDSESEPELVTFDTKLQKIGDFFV